MNRRTFLLGVGGVAAGLPGVHPSSAGSAETPNPEPHFPDRLHLFVWRNWELANAERMAEVVRCRPEDVLAIGSSMGLGPKPRLSPDQLRRLYVTVIRQNWRLLPNDQLTRLLGWTDEKFRFTLKEDDFLDVKLGPKPPCPQLVYAAPGPEARQRAAEIRRTIETYLGSEQRGEAEPAFAFIRRLSAPASPPARDPAAKPSPDQVDVSGWAVKSGGGVDARVAQRLAESLQASTNPGRDRNHAGTVLLRIDSNLGAGGERFTVKVEDAGVEVVGNGPGGLLQCVYWLQDQVEENGGPFLNRGHTERRATFDLRYLYSYFALYGDPLLEPDADPFPDGYLEKLGRVGVNGVWMQGILRNLASSRIFPEFGEGSEERLANLDRLVRRAKRFGLKVYLYLNEPRALPAEFFRDRPGMRGVREGGVYALCTAVPEVRRWISDSVAHVFERVPELGGVFSITMSENLTNCFSHLQPGSCPRCSKRANWGEGVGEVLEAIRAGVRRSSKEAEVIVWDWGWTEAVSDYLIPRLPGDVRLLSVSEWDAPVRRGGVTTKVGEYSMSVVGPGPRALAHWSLARKAGVPVMAKVQLNNTWEISAAPAIPVGHLVARHCANLVKAGVGGLMESWTLGGYPSANLEIAREVCFAPADGLDQVLGRVARRRYGAAAAPLVVQAWKAFSDAFEELPYGVNVYVIPTQHGPANLLRARPTGVKSSMILFPQDDYRAWAGAYPPEVVRDQFARMADGWEKGLPLFRKAVAEVPPGKRAAAEEDLAIAETCLLYFRSVANQVEFYLLRDGKQIASSRARMRTLVEQEMDLARRLFALARRHSVIGYEASNHYYYRPADLAEKVLNCRYLLDHELSS